MRACSFESTQRQNGPEPVEPKRHCISNFNFFFAKSESCSIRINDLAFLAISLFHLFRAKPESRVRAGRSKCTAETISLLQATPSITRRYTVRVVASSPVIDLRSRAECGGQLGRLELALNLQCATVMC